MKEFAELYEELDSTTSTNEKVAALRKYFEHASPEDSMWTLILLTGKLSRRTITSRTLNSLFLASTHYPEWLWAECRDHVGDSAETLSLLAHSLKLCREVALPHHKSLSEWMEEEIPNLAKIKDEVEQADRLLKIWKKLTTQEVYIVNKLITGAFRVGVSEKLVIRALSEVYDVPTDQIAHRMSGSLESGAEAFEKIVSQDTVAVSFSQPYPFCLAHPWNERSEKNFDPSEWCIEWKYDGIRAQVIRRESQTWIWSRGEEDITATFPELAEIFSDLPEGSVIDGEILVFKDERISSFQALQRRLGRKKVSAQMLKEFPAGFMGYDCLEINGQDIRQETLRERKKSLGKLLSKIKSSQVRISPVVEATSLEHLNELRNSARDKDSEGLMIKWWAGIYSVGRKTGNWWKYKVDPLTLDAVLLYAQSGTGRRSNLYTDYTFALWNENKELIPFAKAYSGLDQKEIDELDAWIRRHTKEKFGPVRSVTPEHVFEIGFEGIGPSTRHKSGIAVRFPRILRWRKDKKVEDADTLDSAQELLKAVNGEP
ncbi:ATP-dependent DNA ligase [Bdellovibrio sp. SKB1291214]|uniref:ATP-dependent DNA ligase n=1 Tax=Bdellovibrio sp. SKB1291214 TaxID=1732569 RepID=UPI000B51D49B|nr:ATP-dependent DNA ligase [Bdellovibrio sp. SKB1291214]UYL07992.1 ATP-dependent DNA ligase [Bdellovibrio sp. SKB1291214]